MENKDLILEFLSYPVENTDALYERFAKLPGAVSDKGERPKEKYAYLRGAREDRVLLVAHIDTVWDEEYIGKRELGEQLPTYKDGEFFSGNKKIGIGADDRAGCAMIWKMRQSGHSILILDGEERNRAGARFLKESNRTLYKEISSHSFIIELDHLDTNHASFRGVEVTSKFKKYIKEQTGFAEKGIKGRCDLDILCDNVCGVNVGIGYYDCHTPKERLVLSEWESTYNTLLAFLQKPQKRYKITLTCKIKRFAKRIINKIKRTLNRGK